MEEPIPTSSLPPEIHVPLRKRLERRLGGIGLSLIVGPIRLMPLGMARAFGRGLGALLYRTLGRYRRVAHKNLNLVYGATVPANERTRMAKAVFRHFGEMASEFVKLPQMGRV